MSRHKQSEQLSITAVSCQDWPVIEKMFADAFQHDIYFTLMQRRLRLAQKFSCLSAKMSALLAGNIYLLWSDNEPAGFLILKKLGDKQMHLHYVAVAPEFRRQGLGRELTVFAINAARECGADIFLETEADSPAMQLYNSLGFSVDNQFPIFRLVLPAALPNEAQAAAQLIPVEEDKGIRTRAKEWLLGYKASVLACNLPAEMPLSFHICQPAAGSAAIIHCNLHGASNDLLYQTLPHLALHMKNSDGAYLVVSGAVGADIVSTWLGNRINYVTMTRKQQA
ncbi:MAG: Acetyltransferase domain [Firmicutes bacterium]|nr:Acetyltransferase domain [Bacillota bacterium]